MELKNGTSIYYDGLILERIIKADTYSFETKDGYPNYNDPINTDVRITPRLNDDFTIKIIKDFLGSLTKNEEYKDLIILEVEDPLEIWIYTIVTADYLVIKTKTENFADIRECYDYLEAYWYYSVILEGNTYKEVTLDSSGHLRFSLPDIEFLCFDDPEKEPRAILIERIVIFHGIKKILSQIENNLEELKQKKENKDVYNYSLEKFVEIYKEAISEFIVSRNFLEKSSEYYSRNSYITLEYDDWNTFVFINSKCEEHLLSISILEKDFDLLKELYLLKANERILNRSNTLLIVAIITLLVTPSISHVQIYVSKRRREKIRNDEKEINQGESKWLEDVNIGFR